MSYNSYKIREIQEKDLESGFFETLENLSEVGSIKDDVSKAKEILDEIKVNNKIFVAVDETEKIIGSITLIIEKKFIHNGGRVGHIEDVVTRKGYEGRGVGKSLVKECIEVCRKKDCYKIILNCFDDNVEFYKKIGFKKYDNGMRLNLR